MGCVSRSALARYANVGFGSGILISSPPSAAHSVHVHAYDRTLERVPGADAYTDGGHDRVDNRPCKARAARFVPAPRVRAHVARGLQELVDEEPVGGVYLDPVEAGAVHTVARGGRVRGNVRLYLGLGQRAGCGWLAVERDRRCGDVRRGRVVFREETGVGCTSECPELEKDVGAFGMDSVRDLDRTREKTHVLDEDRIPFSRPGFVRWCRCL